MVGSFFGLLVYVVHKYAEVALESEAQMVLRDIFAKWRKGRKQDTWLQYNFRTVAVEDHYLIGVRP